MTKSNISQLPVQDVLEETLFQGFLVLKTADECYRFLYDICTPSEIKSMKERFQVAYLLNNGNFSYREVNEKTKVSVATITRVARFLFHERYQGYKLILDRLKLPLEDVLDKSIEDQNLFKAILSLKNTEECFAFFYDICTPSEVKSMKERFQVARMLNEKKWSYTEINAQTKVSIATITRVARFLFHEKYEGYKLVINRMGSDN